jgi:hypothetical protein
MKKMIGYVSVDAGILFVGDPCYQSDGRCDFTDWGKFCNSLTENRNEDGILELKHDNGARGKGLVFGTVIGDGIYPVYGNYDKSGDMVSVTIKLI